MSRNVRGFISKSVNDQTPYELLNLIQQKYDSEARIQKGSSIEKNWPNGLILFNNTSIFYNRGLDSITLPLMKLEATQYLYVSMSAAWDDDAFTEKQTQMVKEIVGYLGGGYVEIDMPRIGEEPMGWVIDSADAVNVKPVIHITKEELDELLTAHYGGIVVVD